MTDVILVNARTQNYSKFRRVRPVMTVKRVVDAGTCLLCNKEKEVAADISAMAKAARAEEDYISEQFTQWFLKEQVEEISQMNTLLNVVKRANGNLFEVENHLYRESVGDGGTDSQMPPVAGGKL